MLAASSLPTTLALLAMAGFIGVTSTLMLATVINRLRVQRVLLSWRRGRAAVWPAALSTLVLAALGYAWWAGYDLWAVVLGGYLAGGLFWLVAALLASTVLISEYGVVAHINRAKQAVAWQQVVDYFAAGPRYVFFYEDKEGVRRRLDLRVPEGCREALCEIVEAKVDARFGFAAQRAYGHRALEE